MSEESDHIHARALAALSQGLADVEGFVPLSERDQIAADIVAAVRPGIRAQAAEEITELLDGAADTPSAILRLGGWLGRAREAAK